MTGLPGITLPGITLILGGARSGKSRLAESLVLRQGAALYLATGQAHDGEMTERIAKHRSRRGTQWQTIEEPCDIARIIATAERPVLVDCLTLWLTNLLQADRDISAETETLLVALDRAPVPVVLVATEVGLGIVPDNALARAFRDHAGIVNQRVASIADLVLFVAAGLPLTLKGHYVP
ncbi:MAG TPA: bifunctional adenosylcobinamide kinase/adenosylcobinamide-phosphate guanylyltransferase [Stellaceae bacterium]|jgi:adenosylcobinamide kinase/adenosylcobinamide-phosphate guanylyltransferase|nr:bifunctional adenosylcobinamide kinase/adenosylcobinamide-phosphate guanylyltransferase [Stellaceae bacterium]